MRLFNIVLILLAVSSSSIAQTTGTNSAIQQHEAVEKQKQSDRQEQALQSEAQKPNAKSSPIVVNTDAWGIDKNLRFDITNHLLAYSAILEPDQTLQGVKLTGLLNIAYYSVEKKTATGRSQSRFVFGLESPIVDFTEDIHFWAGLGGTLGDAKGFYFDAGLEYLPLSWFKLQAGMNYNSSTGVYPQLSAGFVW